LLWSENKISTWQLHVLDLSAIGQVAEVAAASFSITIKLRSPRPTL